MDFDKDLYNAHEQDLHLIGIHIPLDQSCMTCNTYPTVKTYKRLKYIHTHTYTTHERQKKITTEKFYPLPTNISQTNTHTHTYIYV